MAQEIEKHLERAKRYLEKNKLRDAITEYQTVLELAPTHLETLQALADIYGRMNEPGKAAYYYGLQFDRLVEAGDAAKAAAIFGRFLKAIAQPPDRLAHYGLLLQRQNRAGEAIECYSGAARGYIEEQQGMEALSCLEKVAQLDPENPARHVELAVLAEGLGQAEVAGRGFLRAAQLTLSGGELDQALELFARAQRLAPDDRSVALFYAEALLRKGNAAFAVELLEPFSPSETDTAFLGILGEALLRTANLDRARQTLEAYYRQKPDSFGKLFELANAFLKADEESKAVEVLAETKEWMLAVRRENEFATQVDRLCGLFPQSLPLTVFWARLYEDLNREAKYFDALVRLFDLYLAAGKMKEACETLDRLVDIDPYDFRNHQRIALLEGKADPDYLRSVQARAAKATAFGQPLNAGSEAKEPAPSESLSEEARARQALDDLIVQVEIFLQYSLQAKAVERLERIAEIFPGEEEKNDRLRALYERANWWPKGAPPPKAAPPAAAVPTPAADTHRDLAAIAEITRLMYRQATPREVIAGAVREIGTYLGAARCLAAVGPPGEAQMTAEFSTAGLPPAGGRRTSALVSQLVLAASDALGGIEIQGAAVPSLRDLGLETALGVMLTDKEHQTPAGVMLVGSETPRQWKPNESYFLQAVGDQLVLCVNHTKLRSLVRTLAVADERTGLLGRGAYLDCLLAEANRSKSQGTPVSLILLQVDRGPELLRQHGDAAFDRYLEELARTLEPIIRQTDLAVKYTAWSLAFILPDTPIENARMLADKLRQASAGVRIPWAEGASLSAVVAEASRHAGDDAEDRVTEWINRAESGLDETRHRGGDTVLSLAMPNL